MDEGSVIPAIKGKITETYKRGSGTSKRGAYSYQSGEISDSDGNKVRFTFWNHPDISKFKGKIVYITADSSSGSPKGVQFIMGKDSSDNPRPELKIEKAATISLPDSAQSHDRFSNDPEMQHPDLDAATPPQRQNSAPPASTPKGPVSMKDIDPDVRRAAIQIANLRVLAERTADYVVTTYNENFEPTEGMPDPRPFSDEHIQAIASGIFIALDRSGCASRMPAKRITPPAPPQPPKREDPPEPAPDI